MTTVENQTDSGQSSPPSAGPDSAVAERGQRKSVTFAPETVFVERQWGAPVIITHTVSTEECVLYGIQLAYGGRKWNIGRRYRHFAENHKNLIKEGIVAKSDLPDLPRKRIFPIKKWRNKVGRSLNKGTEKEEEYIRAERQHVFERKCQLEVYLFKLVTTDKLMAESRVLQEFLEMPGTGGERKSRSSSEFKLSSDSASLTKALLSGRYKPGASEDEDDDDADNGADTAVSTVDIALGVSLSGGEAEQRISDDIAHVTAAEKKKTHVSYRLQISYGGSTWTVSRRYRSIAANHRDLIKEGLVSPSELPHLPKRRLFSLSKWSNKIGSTITSGPNEYEEQYVERRKEQLDAYVAQLFSIERLVTESKVMRDFFELPFDVKERWGSGERFNADLISIEDLGTDGDDDDDGSDDDDDGSDDGDDEIDGDGSQDDTN